jgi:hypothetical protein
MTVHLDDDDSLDYLEGGWPALTLECRVEDELYYAAITEPVIVVLSDGTIAFYLAGGLVL